MFDRDKLNRYRQFAGLLLKYGRSDFLEAASAEFGPDIGGGAKATGGETGPEALANDLAALGPTFVKLAQMLSTRGDLLSPPYLDALSRLQDDVDGLPFETVREIVVEELGQPLMRVFDEFNPQPTAAASLGQVHRAVLAGGREVAVKVQRPGVRERIVEDLDIFDDIAGAVDRHTELGRRFGFRDLVERFRTGLLSELDYRQEAQNLVNFGVQLERFEHIRVPQPVAEHTTARVLTMDFVHGRSVSGMTPERRESVDGQELARILCEAYMHQILVDGVFHSDPHPGNVLLTDSGDIALIDFGLVNHVDPELRLRLLRLLLAVCDGRGRETAELGIELGRRLDDANIPRILEQAGDLVARRRTQIGDERKLGRTVLDLARTFGMNGVRPPPELGLLGKTLLSLDEVTHALDPDFDPDRAVNGYADNVLREQLLGGLSPSQGFSKMLDLYGFAQKVPRRVSALLDALVDGQLRVKVDAIDENRLIGSLEKIGNRIALGLVLAALIVGAALVMQVETDSTLFGYPALAIVLFLIAVILGFGMVLWIVLFDRSPGGRR